MCRWCSPSVNLLGLAGVRDGFPNTSLVFVEHGHSLLINPSLWMYQEIPPSLPISIDSVRINLSLVMVRECIAQCGLDAGAG